VGYLQPKIATRIGQLVLLALSSDQPGEVTNALAAARRTLAGAGLTIHDVATALERGLAPPPRPPPRSPPPPPEPEPPSMDWRGAVAFCDRHRDQLFGQESGLIDTLLRWRGVPTPKQMEWLGRIMERIRAN
jgi:hypothetical protein